jgi:hypothetical protein
MGPTVRPPEEIVSLELFRLTPANPCLPESDRNQRLLRSGLFNDRIHQDRFRHKDVGVGTCRDDPRHRSSVQACGHV